MGRTWSRPVPCCLYELQVDGDTYRRLRRRLLAMYARRGQYGYNLLGAVSCWLELPLRRRDRYFCSQFVADLLQGSGAAVFPKPPALLRPMDLCQLEGLRPVHRGDVHTLLALRAA